MGGGGSSAPSEQPYDMLGGQYASFTGGTPLPDYSALGAGFGKGLQTFGSAVSQGSRAPASGGVNVPNLQQFTIPTNAQAQSSLIPTNQDPSQQIMQLLQQLLGGG